MKLTVLERLMLLGVLPSEGDISTLRIVRDLRGELSFSEQETADLKLSSKDGTVTWDNAKDPHKDVPIGLRARNIIVDTLTSLSNQKKLQSEHLDLYDRFVEERE